MKILTPLLSCTDLPLFSLLVKDESFKVLQPSSVITELKISYYFWVQLSRTAVLTMEAFLVFNLK